MGLDMCITHGVGWHQIGQGSHQQMENSIQKTTRKTTGNHLTLFFRRQDMDIAILSRDNGINKAVNEGLVESRSAGDGVRHSRLSSKILTTSVGRKMFHLKVACCNVFHRPCYKNCFLNFTVWITIFQLGSIKSIKGLKCAQNCFVPFT